MSSLKTLSTESQSATGLPRILLAAMLCLMLAPAVQGADTKPVAPGDADTDFQAGSTFQIPRTLSEGRDPFFPTSTRVLALTRPPDQKASGPATLELKGISGTPDQPLAIINNRTLAVGEAQDINTDQGRVRVMCLGIEGTKVKIRVQGEVRELMLRKGI